jgi:hypothetical protein
MVLRWKSSSPESDRTVEQHVIEGHTVIVMHNIFSGAELEEWLQLSRSIKYTDAHTEKAVRDCERIVVSSEALAKLMWQRSEETLKQNCGLLQQIISPEQAGDFGPGSDGQWDATGLNNLFRLCRYPEGGHFAPHADGSYLLDSDHRSLLTFMAYLTDDFEGGGTAFLQQQSELQSMPEEDCHTRFHARAEDVLLRLKPAAGSVVAFLQCVVLHCGERVQPSGACKDPAFPKHILRTDVMFERKAATAQALTEKQQQARVALAEAQRLEAEGEFARAVTAYQRASRLDPDMRI